MIEGDGRNFIFAPFANYAAYNLDCCREMMQSPHTLIGLGDGGAHAGTTCDASTPTTMLTQWARDRADGIPLETVERMRTALAQGGAASRDSQIVVYPEAPHAFNADYRPSYRKDQAEDGWKRALAWFKANGV